MDGHTEDPKSQSLLLFLALINCATLGKSVNLSVLLSVSLPVNEVKGGNKCRNVLHILKHYIIASSEL